MTSQETGRLTARRSLGTLAFVIPLATAPMIVSFDAIAATDTATLSVTATVQSSCAVSGGTLDFGNYQVGQATNSDAVGTISYTNCTGTLTFELDGGQAGNVNSRAMTSGNSTLSYQLYRSSLRNSVFGTGSNSQVSNIIGVTPLNGTVEVYGRIPSGQDVAPGSYSDTVNITLTY